MSNEYLIAIDAGGSKCHAALFEKGSNKLLAEYKTGAANLATDFSQAISHIEQACIHVLKACNLPLTELKHIQAYAGLAGVNYPQVAHQLSQWQHPFAEFYFTTDLHFACYAAHQDKKGNALIVGTGSCGIAITENETHLLGGYGHKLGDQASAAWLGLLALQHTLLVLDKLEPDSILADKICQFSQINNAAELSQYWHNARPNQFGELARFICEAAQQNDLAALSIIEQAVDYLAKLIRQLMQIQASSICILGGLSQSLMKYLPAELKPYLAEAKQTQPVYGGLILAQFPELALNALQVDSIR